MRVARLLVALPLLCGFLLAPLCAYSGGIGVSTGPCEVPEITTFSFTDSFLPFRFYKVPAFRSPLGRRDLEFLWSDTYAQSPQNKPLVPPGSNEENDLDRFAKTLCEQRSNPFGFDYSDIQLVYDYFSVRGLSYRPDTTYDDDPNHVGFRVADPVPPEADAERTHVDTYLWEPNLDLFALDRIGDDDDPLDAGRYPSIFTSSPEDSLTADPATYHRNSIHFFGPPYTNVDDTGANRWTRADSIYNQGFNHEFEHCLNNDNFNTPQIPFVHMLASAAEAVGGMSKLPPLHDVAYTWNLNRGSGNYEAWLSFGAYIAYNFRGTDLSGTPAGLSDDLLWRWAKQPDRRLSSLIARLSPAQCDECSTRVYFQNRSPQDRFRILLHNWRIAQYVNRHDLATSQGDFGYPPQFNFRPWYDIGSWRNVAPSVADSTNVPHEVTITRSHISRDSSFVGGRGGAKAHALRFERFGSDYWVLRSDPWVQQANRDLVIRITPEGWCSGIRLMASAITYSNLPGAGDSLWKHPEWATGVIGPASQDLEELNIKPFEIVIPNFGATHKAVLVVMTTSQLTDDEGAQNILTYRLNTALRTGTYLSPNPVVSFRDGAFVNLPAWNPNGDSLVFTRNASVYGELHVKAVNQSGSRRLVNPPQTQSPGQSYATWSPRGDWVAFVQESTTTNCNVLLYNTITGALRRLASTQDHELYPAFSPNGQQLVYSRYVSSGGNWQLRRINLDGTNDTVLVQQTSAVLFPRWAPDGQTIYFLSGTSGTTLYAVSSNGGNPILKSHLMPAAYAFDLPLGKGRIVAEEDWRPVVCAASMQPPTRRLVARDTTAAESEMLFFSGGIKPYSPRLSFDNTRVAFVVDSAGARDIRVGQIGYNHAPRFNAQYMVDAQVDQSIPVSFTVSATDADGESVTFEAAYLPPGATFSSSGAFYWPNPQPYGATYYVVLRAIDESGGVDNRVIMYQVGPGGPGGCPMVDGRSADGWTHENSILGRSLTGDFATDYYRLRNRLEPVEGRYQIRIRENEQEHTTLDQVKLWAVDHEANQQAFATPSGVMLGERRAPYRVTTSEGRDVTHLLDGSGEGFQGDAGDILLVEMNAPGAPSDDVQGLMEEPCCMKDGGAPDMGRAAFDPAADMRTDERWLKRTGVLVQVPEGAGGWRTIQHRYPRAQQDQLALDLAGYDRMRVVFMGSQRLKSLGGVARSRNAEPQELTLLTARHSNLGNMLGAVLGSGGSTASLDPGDTLSLDFAAPPIPEGKVRDWFLVSTGVYTSDLPDKRAPRSASVPIRFALDQNRPNPFSKNTTIRFELPVSSGVRLEVFDLGGRRIAKLADREYPAGYHTVEWDRTTIGGRPPAPGVYVYRIIAGSFRDQKKMILLP